MELKGSVENIVFRNEENGWTVAKISEGGHLYTVVGKLLQCNVGQYLVLEGQFVTNSRFGQQFSFDSYEIIMPTSPQAIEKYLSSGLIKGVGPVTAKSIVQRFGVDTLTILEYSPEKLAVVRGVSKAKAIKIGESFNEHKKVQNAVIFLQNYNISINMAMKIYQAYHEKTIELVKENPYRLVEDIDGIGFLTADTIAEKMGIDRKSEFRVRAGLLHCIGEACEKTGDTLCIYDELLANTLFLLKLDGDCTELFQRVLDRLVLEKKLMHFWNKNRNCVMLTNLYFCESSIAKKLCLLQTLAQKNNLDIDQDLAFYEQTNKVKLHSVQKDAIKMAVNNGVCVITGGPGTGKTTIVKAILTLFKQQNKSILLCAPTGRASKRLNESTSFPASTIHRALEPAFKQMGGFVYNEKNPLEYDVVIVDEVSMVDANLMNALLKALPRTCTLVLVGDKDQLPSVGAGNVLDDIIKSEIFPVVKLEKIFRQEEGLIITNAHLINKGEMPIFDNKSGDFFYEGQTEPQDICDSIVSLATKRIPNYLQIDTSRVQVLAPLKAGVNGTTNLNTVLQQQINPPSPKKAEVMVGATTFRTGDKVMNTVNNYDIEWCKKNPDVKYGYEHGSGVFNGDIGYVYSISDNGETVVWFEDGRECTFQKTDLSSLQLAYAITVHKSQGSEFDVVIIPLVAGPPLILTRNLIYTAVTRAKTMVVLVGEKKLLARMIHNNRIIQRKTMLKSFLEEEQKIVSEMFDD